MYGVSANAVKKWLKSYNISVNFRYKTPLKVDLINELKLSCPTEVARNRNIDPSVVLRWMSEYEITFIPSMIKCVETGLIYESMLKAADAVYPQMSRKSVGNFLGKVIDTEKDYHGYHWVRTDKIVC